MKVLIFGDSHSVYFNLTQELKDINESFRGIETKVVKMTAATILGFGKRKSTLNSRDKFIDEYKSFKPDYVVFALGQVDIELGLYYRLVVKKEKIITSDYLSKLSEEYISSINEISQALNIDKSKVVIKGINLSVLTKSRQKAINYTAKVVTENIENKGDISKYKEHLSHIFPSNYERIKIHMDFNEVLKLKKDVKHKYFDINKDIVGPLKPGQCKAIFIPAYSDHHLLDSLYLRELSINKMIQVIVNI